MKTIKLFFDFEFTSLSPDAQPISLGIVSCDTAVKLSEFKTVGDAVGFAKSEPVSKSFYCEFTDFDINRCDDWVKENVVGKLHLKDDIEKEEKLYQDACIKFENFDKRNSWLGVSLPHNAYYILQSEREDPENLRLIHGSDIKVYAAVDGIKQVLSGWLCHFKDYQIQFVCDCGTYDWCWMVQLLAEWEEKEVKEKVCSKCGSLDEGGYDTEFTYRTGLPRLPDNISPAPEDLNDLIASKKGISHKEAFDLSREELALRCDDIDHDHSSKHSAIWDAKVIKEIYQKLE